MVFAFQNIVLNKPEWTLEHQRNLNASKFRLNLGFFQIISIFPPIIVMCNLMGTFLVVWGFVHVFVLLGFLK